MNLLLKRSHNFSSPILISYGNLEDKDQSQRSVVDGSVQRLGIGQSTELSPSPNPRKSTLRTGWSHYTFRRCALWYRWQPCTEMSESGQKQSSQLCSAHVRFIPESGLILWHSDESALCHFSPCLFWMKIVVDHNASRLHSMADSPINM